MAVTLDLKFFWFLVNVQAICSFVLDLKRFAFFGEENACQCIWTTSKASLLVVRVLCASTERRTW